MLMEWTLIRVNVPNFVLILVIEIKNKTRVVGSWIVNM